MKRKTTDEILREAFERDGYTFLPVGYTPPRRKLKPVAKRPKAGKNGKPR